MASNVKILLSYHKKDHLFKDEILTPIHAGRANREPLSDTASEETKWLYENMEGDNTGDNISEKNSLYNEMSTVYWAYKNYDKLGDPDYIGFMHYRRHFIFDETLEKGNYEAEDIGADYFEQINYSPETVRSIVESCDFVTVKPLFRHTLYDHYKINHNIEDMDRAVSILKELYPDYVDAADEYLNGEKGYFCNMFIFPKETFLRYGEWFFSITQRLENDLVSNRMFISEWLTGIFITKLIMEGKKGVFFPTVIAEGEHEIPIVLAGDNNYAVPMMVVIESLLSTAKKTTTYRLDLLVSNDFSKENMDKIERICKRHEKYKLNFHVMDAAEDDKFVQIEHISAATYYRLKLPELLKDVKKCVYLDCDIVVKKDLSELFRLNVDDKYIAGVPAAGYYYPDTKVQVKLDELGIPDMNSYVNAGVLIMNLANMRRDNLSEEFYFLLNKNFASQDQDILNVACYKGIRRLPFKYNVMTKYPIDDKSAYTKSEMLQRAYTRPEWNGGRKNPVIIHYADICKPWNSVESARMKDWWEVVKLIPEDIAMDVYASFFDSIEEMSETGTQIKTLKAQIKELKEENKESVATLKKQLQKIKSSKAYKLGMFLTWPVRAAKRVFLNKK